jgi:hypothetical protein
MLGEVFNEVTFQLGLLDVAEEQGSHTHHFLGVGALELRSEELLHTVMFLGLESHAFGLGSLFLIGKHCKFLVNVLGFDFSILHVHAFSLIPLNHPWHPLEQLESNYFLEGSYEFLYFII